MVAATLGERPPEGDAEHSSELAQVLDFVQPRAGQHVADIGFGAGWLAAGLAEAVGSGGRVYAVEIDRDAVARLRARGLANVEVVHSKRDDVSLPAESLDLAVLHDVASHVRESARPAFYASVARALRPEGRLILFGPHGGARAMLAELAGYGFHAEGAAELAELSERELDARLERGIALVHR